VDIVRTSREALQYLHLREVDMLLASWELAPVDGLQLVKNLRQSEIPTLSTLPIIMLSAHATMQDNQLARDAGVTEFLVKPYTVETLFRTLERLIDMPRDFIISRHFTGPDRRQRSALPPEHDRRINAPKIFSEMPRDLPAEGEAFRLVAERKLQKKMKVDQTFGELITPEMLQQAQATIDSFRDSSSQWIADNILELDHALEGLLEQDQAPANDEAQAQLLDIKSRAGMFNYRLASQVAYDLYRFLRRDYEKGNHRHKMLIRKHMEVIKVLLAQRVEGEGTASERALLEGLQILMKELNRSDFYEEAAAAQSVASQ
jgi:CheY-like chemotaxis protein